jgi:hypothetical protein
MSDAAATSDDAQSDAGQAGKKQRKARLSQEDVPGYPLDQALKVAQTLADNYAYKPTRPISVAEAMSMAPTGRGFRGVTGAAVAYGLTTAAYNSPEIGLTPIGMRIVRPTTEGDDLAARREALLKPRVIGEFLRHFDGAALPADHIGRNVLIDKAVPADRATEVFNLIVEGAAQVGFIREWNGKRYVDLAGSQSSDGDADSDSDSSPTVPAPAEVAVAKPATAPLTPTPIAPAPTVSMSSGVNINIEIHIAADASTQTIEDIFRSMRRYVLKPEDDTSE